MMKEIVLLGLFTIAAPIFLWLLLYVMAGSYKTRPGKIKALGAVVALSAVIILAFLVTT